MTASINCPYCDEEVPVRIRIPGELTGTYPPFKYGYIDIGGLSSELDKPMIDYIISPRYDTILNYFHLIDRKIYVNKLMYS